MKSYDVFAELYTIMDKKERIKRLKELVDVDNTGEPSCSICKSNFSSTYSVVRHIEATHVRMRGYQCDFCEKRFTTQSQKSHHEGKTHKNILRPAVNLT